MGIIAWIVVGLIAGWLAHMVLGGRGGLFGNLAVGLVGAIVAGAILPRLHIFIATDFLGNIISATIGAVIFLFIWRAIRRA
ncbi:MAG: GlsB/YeaQ/YmgE family stress response membrane protein [Proteobacteria bacterium]|nr:GlsB/YeaQ/YmgE family stress response membrane protein [Pseudomonadota bacterium]